MDKDNGPDTIPLKMEAACWTEMHAQDAFSPVVRVARGWRDMPATVKRGAVPVQARAQQNDAAPQGISRVLILGLSLLGAIGGALLGYLAFTS